MSNFGPSPTPRLWNRTLASPGVPEHGRRAGDVQAGGAAGQETRRQGAEHQGTGRQGTGQQGTMSQEGVFQEGAFRDRRRQDGLGLLPPARTPAPVDLASVMTSALARDCRTRTTLSTRWSALMVSNMWLT